MVNVTTIIVGEEKGDAELTNLAENVIREDMSLMDLCRSVNELVNNGVKQSNIAKKLASKSPRSVSTRSWLSFLRISALASEMNFPACTRMKEVARSCGDC